MIQYSKFLKELKGAVKEVSLAKKGKIKLQSAKDFLNELQSNVNTPFQKNRK